MYLNSISPYPNTRLHVSRKGVAYFENLRMGKFLDEKTRASDGTRYKRANSGYLVKA